MQNTWVGYIQRSYRLIKDAVIAKFAIKIPELTDHSESNPLIKMLSVWSGIAEMLGYYIDYQAREAFLVTCTRFKSAVKFAKQVGYRVKGQIPASVEMRFYFENPLPSPVLIPIGTEVQTNDEIIFTTTENLTIPSGESEGFVDAVQQISFSNEFLGTSDGSASQVFSMGDKIVDSSVIVFVDGSGWTSVDSFIKSFQESKHYVAGLGETAEMEVTFGDGFKGELPVIGQELRVNYAVSEGELGNVAPNTVTEVVTSISTPSGFVLKATNPARAVGGANAETLEDLKRKIPIFVRTQERAVTREDYRDVALLAGGVGKAGVFYECGKFVEVYVSPVGGGLATETLLSNVEVFFKTRKMVTTKVTARAAGALRAIVELDLEVLGGFVRADVVETLKENIASFLSADAQDIGGRVKINDLIEVFETSQGVDVTSLIRFYLVPYARPLNDNNEQLDWTPNLKTASQDTVKWEVRFISDSIYQVVKDDVFIANFNVGSMVMADELTFTIHSNYSAGKTWQFYTYPYSFQNFIKSIVLREPSLPLVLDLNDITINAEGGI